jgi:hypothetical protein
VGRSSEVFDGKGKEAKKQEKGKNGGSAEGTPEGRIGRHKGQRVRGARAKQRHRKENRVARFRVSGTRATRQ